MPAGSPPTQTSTTGPSTTGPRKHDQPHARARLISEHSAIIAGQATTLGVTFEIDEHWHLYWDGQSDSGLPPRIKLKLPEGFTAGPVQWPAPKRLVVPGPMLDYVYEDRVTLLIPLQASTMVATGSTAEIKADLEWLVCKDVCVGGEATLSLALPILSAGQDVVLSSDVKTLFAQARNRLPRQWPMDASAPKLEWSEDRLIIRAADAKKLAFYAGNDGVPLADAVTQGEAMGDTLALNLDWPSGAGSSPRVRGVLELWPRDAASPSTTMLYAVDLPVPRDNSTTTPPPSGSR
ncbi:MAG: hypothetical protein H7Y88_00220 [Phycisphaerales bacterium]|nr:hypothetical protein [Phycisphaerales bacterium]